MSPQPKLPPFDIEAEQSVLGAMILDNRMIDDVAEAMQPADLYREDHQVIYRAILFLRARNQPVDFITVCRALKDTGELDSAGGKEYVGTIANDTPAAENAMAYANAVRSSALLRRLIAIGGDIATMGYSPGAREAHELVDEAQRLVMSVGETIDDDGTNVVGDLCDEWSAELERRLNSGEAGMSLPFEKLTEATGGLEDGDLVIIAGRAGTGKTTFALQVGDHIASMYGDVAGFSLEMPRAQWMTRLVSAKARIDNRKLRDPKLLSTVEWDAMTRALADIRSARLHFNDRPATLDQIRRRCRKLQRQLKAKNKRLRAVVIDYLQKAAEASTKGTSRAEKVKAVSDGLKTLAKELRCPVIAISQTNRDADKRDNRRPRLADLSEGNIEADADIVIGLYRDELVTQNSTSQGIAEAIILKQRNGPLATVELEFNGEYSNYSDYSGPPAHIRESETPAAKKSWGKKKSGLIEALNGETP